jgi:threonyl-tRNA synthetase
MSPRQVLIVPVSSAQNAYAEELKRILTVDKLHVDVDLRDSTLNKKIRTGQQEKYNFIFGRFDYHRVQ